MQNILVFQPYLSNRKLSSNTVERQFRFLTKDANNRVYVLLNKSEVDYAHHLAETTKFYPIVLDYLLDNVSSAIDNLIDIYDFQHLYIARTYFTPCTQDIIEGFKTLTIEKDDRYWRNLVPIKFANYGRQVHHIIYDPLEMQYDELIDKQFYTKYSSMTNVDNAKAHNFADIGYYDKGMEVSAQSKQYKFTFGGTAFSEERERLIEDIYNRTKDLLEVNTFIRTKSFDNLVNNDVYEDLTSKSLFTYTIPSQCNKYMSFTRMLLALSQGTIPLIHPDNNLDCLFGEGFEFREDLQELFEELIVSPETLQNFIQYNSMPQLKKHYNTLMDMWHSTKYYQWLQDNC